MRTKSYHELGLHDKTTLDKLLVADDPYRKGEFGPRLIDSAHAATKVLHTKLSQFVETQGYTPTVVAKKRLFREDVTAPLEEHGLVVNRRVVLEQEYRDFNPNDHTRRRLDSSLRNYDGTQRFPSSTRQAMGSVMIDSVRDATLLDGNNNPGSGLLIRSGLIVPHNEQRYFAPVSTFVVPGPEFSGKLLTEHPQMPVLDHREGRAIQSDRTVDTFSKIMDHVIADDMTEVVNPAGIILPEGDSKLKVGFPDELNLLGYPDADVLPAITWVLPNRDVLAQMR